MSNFLTIAAVTESLRFLLSAAIEPVISGVVVSTGKPVAATQGDRTPRVNVFLYQATQNAYWRGEDLPTRGADGSVVQRPRAALDLHYLITCYGEDATQDDQQLLALVVRTLHGQPCLTHDVVSAAVASATNGWLNASNLVSEPEIVRITPMQLSLEEMSKLWSVFYLTQYELSVAYVARPVFIDAEAIPISVMPVLERNIYVVTGRTPIITAIAPSTAPGSPIVAGTGLVVTGNDLLAPSPAVTQVMLDGVPTPFATQTSTTTRLDVALPSTLAVGGHRLQVVQPMAIGHGQHPPLHPAFESNLTGFVLQPRIVGSIAISNLQGSGPAPRSATLTFSVDPPIVAGQVASLSLISLADGTALLSITVSAGPNPLSVQLQGAPAGDYYARVTVAGVDSPFTRDTDPNSPTAGLWNGPKVTLA